MLNNINKSLLILFPILTVCIFLNIYYEGVIYKLNNIQSVLIFCLLCLLIVRKSSFNFHKETLIIYLFIFICLISCFFSENIPLSLKRFTIIFVPFFLVFQTYLNIKDIENIKNKFETLFIYLVLFLIFYALLIFIVDFLSNEAIDPRKISKSNFFGLGQIYYPRNDIFKGFLRPSSLLSNTIGLSHLILMAIIINHLNKNLNSSFRKANFLILIPSLLWTFSRVNILILFLFPLILILSKKRSFLIILLFGIELIFLFVIILNYPSFNQFINIDFDKLGFGRFIDRFEVFRIVMLKIETYFITGVGFGVSSENFIMKFYDMFSSFYQVTHQQDLAIASVPLTILVETGLFGFITYASIIPILIIMNKNFKFKEVKNIFCLLIVVQLTQFSDISLFRFHMLTFLFAIYLGISCNKNLKIND